VTNLLPNFFGQKKLLLTLFSFISVGIVIATLWPFDFHPPNGASWIPNRNGIHFSQPAGIAVSASPLLIPSASTKNSVTIELWLRSDEIWSSRTALAIYNPSRGVPFLIRQWDGGLSISRDSLDSPGSAIGDKIYAKRIFQRGVPLLLTITSSPSGTLVYVNAAQKQSFPSYQIRAGDLSGQIILGTAPDSFAPWRGDIYFVALYASALSPEEIRLHFDCLSRSSPASHGSDSLLAQYSFAESSGSVVSSSLRAAPNLQIPKTFFLPYKPILQSPLAHYEATKNYFYGAFLNIVGFVPFGILLCAYLANTRFARFAVLHSFLSGAAFSFIIELIQGYIPQRDSGFNDVITNSLGALLGAVLARSMQRK